MKRQYRDRAVCLSVLAASLIGTAATAQDVGADGIDGGGDIIVTARRVEERLQDVPISMTVFSQEQLNSRNIYNAGDLGTYTPSLSTNSRYGPEKTSFAIRGFTQELKTSPSVGVYFAEVVAPRANGGTTSGNGAGVGQLFDLQNIQVLKGPQGTLFGRNTTGGAILLVPKKPTSRLEGYVEGSLGNYDMRRLQSVVNVPLSDSFRIRAGVDRNKRDGYLKNRSNIGPKDFADTDYIAARLSIVGDLTPDLENYTVASFSESDTNGVVPRMFRCDRARAATAAGFIASLGCAQVDRQAARGDGFWDVENSELNPYARTRQWQVINTTTWRASENLTIKNIVSYAEFQEAVSMSLNGENLVLPTGMSLPTVRMHPGVYGYNARQSTFTEELQFQGTTSDARLNWQVGAYLELSKPLGFSSAINQILLPCTDYAQAQCSDVLGAPQGTTVGSLANAQYKDIFNSKGVYGQATYKLTERFSVTGGIRYTVDKSANIAQNLTVRFPAANTPQLTCQNVLKFNSNPVTLAPLPVGSPEACRSRIDLKSEKPTWQIGGEFKPSEDLMLYGKWARGYRAGGISFNNLGLETWAPEKVDTFEVGAKATFRGAVSGYFNLAGFYNDFRDQQLAASLRPLPQYQGSLGGAQAIVNAGKSRIWGIEAETSLTLLHGLRLDGGYTYLNTKLTQIVLPATPPLYQPITSSADLGGPLALSPKHRLTATASYTLPLDDAIGAITFGATYTYTSANNATSPAVTPLYRIPATNLVNLNASWNRIGGSPVDLAFFMTNLTNEKFIVFPSGGYSNYGWETAQTNAPRMWGFRVRYTFGQ